MSGSLTIAWKEVRDHVRDRRSLASTAMYALMGPLVLALVSFSAVGQSARAPAVLLGMASVFGLVAAFAGGMNVALDVMAGERERRSLVPLLLNPVSAWAVVMGKWIAANVLGAGAVGLNVTGFGLALLWSTPQLLSGRVADVSLWVALGLVPLMLLGSAVHLYVAATSRTMKEANSWLQTAVFVPMIVGMFMIFFPGWIDRWWFLMPIVGQQSLAARVIEAQPTRVVESIVLAAVTVIAVLPFLIAARRVLDRDDLLAG